MRMQGHTDVPLAAEGTEQARRLAARLSFCARPPEAVWSSDLSRAVETAREIAQPLGLSVRQTPLLRETMLGEWEGLTRDQIVERGDGELLALYRADSVRHRPPGAERLEDAWDRMHAAAAEISAAHPAGSTAIVGHGGSLRVLLCAALDAPVTSVKRIWLDNASLSVISTRMAEYGPVTRLMLLNDTAHLSLDPVG